ncbi:MAG TPA: AAA family ATPase [Gemmatimonadaceae bacterium]|jgi:dephospho-CoA kinase
MGVHAPRAPAVIVVVGASGAGKTTLVRHLERRGLSGVGCYYFDTIGVPSNEEIVSRFGDGLGFQEWALDEWLERLTRNEDRVRVAVLDAQVRPTSVQEVLRRHRVERGQAVLVDCEYSTRNARLRDARGQPELATANMDAWAAYLRGQADALHIPIIDTTTTTIEDAVNALNELVANLLSD